MRNRVFLGKRVSAYALLNNRHNLIKPMLLQKTFHMSQALEECKNRLANIHSYRRQLAMVTNATVRSSKTLDFGFRGPLGFEAHTALALTEGESPDEIAFESKGGNIELMGLIEFEEIRPDCTEITLAVHYEIKSKRYAWLDRRFGFVDAFLTSELRSLRSHFEGIAAPVKERAPAFGLFEPLSA